MTLSRSYRARRLDLSVVPACLQYRCERQGVRTQAMVPLAKHPMLTETAQDRQATRCRDHFRKVGMILGGIVTIQVALGCSNSDPASVGTSPLTFIAVSPSEATVAVGDSTRFVAQLVNAPRAGLARCSSSEPILASVELTTTGCTAFGKAAGTAVITITASSGQFAAAKLTVVR